jgi:F-type H+-transporting ATPase subunit b
MLIDWFTIIAQVINFLILILLLKRFLYRPILNAIDEREERIADELAYADCKKAEAEQQREMFQQKNDEFDQECTAVMERVMVDAKAEKERLLNAVREETDALRTTLELAIKNEQASFHETLNHQVIIEVFAIARQALSDLADSQLEVSMANVFVQRLGKLNAKDKANVQVAFNHSDQPLIVHTAFDLPAEQRAQIQVALSDMIGRAANVQFVIEPGVISGIEMNANGQKIAWSIADYLRSLNKRVSLVMQSNNVEHKL